MRIATKMSVLIMALAATFLLASFLIFGNRLHRHLEDSQLEWVQILAQGISEGLAHDTIDRNTVHATELIRRIERNDQAIEYIYITDFDGRLFAHSFESGFPRALLIGLTENQEKDQQDTITILNTKQGPILDYNLRIIDGLPARIHIGLNQSQIKPILRRIDQDLVWITLVTTLIAIIMAAIFSRRTSNQLYELAKQVNLYAGGETSFSARPSSGDAEVLQLFDTFTAMVQARQQAELALRESERNLGLTLDSIGDGVIATDNKGLITRINSIAVQLTGWKEDDAIGRPLQQVFDIVHSVTRQPVLSPVDRVLATGTIIELANHTNLIAKDGHEFQIADSAAPIRGEDDKIIGVILVFRNVTQEYALRNKVVENEQRLQSILDNTPAVIYVQDLEGRYLLVNRRFEELFHVENADIQGKRTRDVFPEELADAMRENDLEVIRQRQPIEYKEIIPHDDGLHTYLSIKFCLSNQFGDPYAVCAISSDITAQILQEEQLRRSQKMEALGKLTGGIAHDFNNMLNVVIGYADLLTRSLDGDPKHKTFAREIRQAGKRAATLTSKLLSVSRDQPVEEVKVDVNTVISDERDLLEKTLTARIQLELDLEDTVWPLRLDKGDLENTLINICINAMHAMQDQGLLTIQTANISMSSVDAKPLELLAGDYVQLSISDTGIGMDEITKSRMFDPFFTTKGEQGTGLGMSQAYGFIQRSHGAVKVYSEQGHGTRIVMYFPRFCGEESVDATGRNLDESKWRGNETVLIVDDEPSLCMLANEILTGKGYRVFTSESAQGALEILANEKVDVLVSDVIMPQVDGYQLLNEVQKSYPEVKVQLASGFADTELDHGGGDSSREPLLQKPYTAESLLRRIRKLLDQAI